MQEGNVIDLTGIRELAARKPTVSVSTVMVSVDSLFAEH